MRAPRQRPPTRRPADRLALTCSPSALWCDRIRKGEAGPAISALGGGTRRWCFECVEVPIDQPSLVPAAALVGSLAGGAAAAQSGAKPSPEIALGKYLVRIGGCNDCHTPGYAPSGGKVDEKLWLTGDQLGFRGPWGTTYATNLRLAVEDMTAEQFMRRARTRTGPLGVSSGGT